MPKGKCKVTIVVRKEITRIVMANNQREAISNVKKAVRAKPLKVGKKDFEKYPDCDGPHYV